MSKKPHCLTALRGQKLYISKYLSNQLRVPIKCNHSDFVWKKKKRVALWKFSLDAAAKLASRKNHYLNLVCTFRGAMTESYFFFYAYAIRKAVKYVQMDSKHFNTDLKFCTYHKCRLQTTIFIHVGMLPAAFVSVFQSENVFMLYSNDSMQEAGIIDNSLTAFSSQRKMLLVLRASCLCYAMPSVIWQMPVLLLFT